MTIIWLLVWLVSDTPALHRWNAWLVSLAVVLFLDFFAGSTRS